MGTVGNGDRLRRESEGISQSMGLLLVSRLMLAGAIVLAGQMFIPPGSTSLALLYVAAAVLVLTILYMFLLRRSHPAMPMLQVQLGADLVVVTWVVTVTGRAESPFVLLYFIAIILAGYFLLVRGGLIVGAAAAIGYLAASFGPEVLGGWAADRGTIFQGGINAVFFLVVGALSGYLGRMTRRQEIKLERTRKELRRARLDTDCIIKNMGSGLLTVDSSHRVTHFNPAAASILRLDETAVRGADLSTLDRAGMGRLSGLIRKTIAEGREIPRAEIELPVADGEAVPVGVSTSVVRDDDGAVTGAVAVFQDLTLAREIERVARSNETLAAIGQLASGVAHEVRNSLGPISGSAEILAEQLHLEGENKQLLDLICRESRHLQEFTSSLLDFARVRPLSLEEVDLVPLIEEVLESVKKHPAFDHEISLEVSPGGGRPAIVADRGLLKAAFLNLGINAVEATPSGGSVTVRIEERGSAASGGGAVLVEFRDTGPGISEKDRERVFEPFYTTKKSGSGLGLAHVKQVASRHGGKVVLESAPGEGTVVRIELPRLARALPRAA